MLLFYLFTLAIFEKCWECTKGILRRILCLAVTPFCPYPEPKEKDWMLRKHVNNRGWFLVRRPIENEERARDQEMLLVVGVTGRHFREKVFVTLRELSLKQKSGCMRLFVSENGWFTPNKCIVFYIMHDDELHHSHHRVAPTHYSSKLREIGIWPV